MNEHTKGPWEVRRDVPEPSPRVQHEVIPFSVWSPGVGMVAEVCAPAGRDWPGRAEANAHLIAAAPELLAALRDVDALAVECERCAGSGRESGSSVGFPDACRRCAGVGDYVPTAGPELLAVRAAIAKAVHP